MECLGVYYCGIVVFPLLLNGCMSVVYARVDCGLIHNERKATLILIFMCFAIFF